MILTQLWAEYKMRSRLCNVCVSITSIQYPLQFSTFQNLLLRGHDQALWNVRLVVSLSYGLSQILFLIEFLVFLWNVNRNTMGISFITEDFPQSHCVEKSLKDSHFYRYKLTLILKPLVIHFCPLKMFSDYFRSFYTVNNQNLKESERI